MTNDEPGKRIELLKRLEAAIKEAKAAAAAPEQARARVEAALHEAKASDVRLKAALQELKTSDARLEAASKELDACEELAHRLLHPPESYN